MISLNNVTFYYNSRHKVLKDFSLNINRGDRVCLSGASGCGKTTVLRLIMGLQTPKKGSVELLKQAKISVVFQEDRLIPTKTVLQNVALFSNDEKALEMLKLLGINEVADEYPVALSGGMKRRVALARALAHDFDILILDEAFTGLDSNTLENCLKVTDKVLADKTLVMVTHQDYIAESLKAKTVKI